MPKIVTKESFIEKCLAIHGHSYDYSAVEYSGNKDKVKIICLTHGVFEQRPSHHTSGHGCPYCGKAKSTTKGRFIDNRDGSYTIPISKGFSVLISKEDYPIISQYSWQVKEGRATKYAKTTVKRGGKKFNISMHRFIMGVTCSTEVVDHINHNGLDNRRINLRIVTTMQNSHNTLRRIGSSIYKGVCKPKGWDKWVAYITVNKKRINLGVFSDELEAAKAYDLKAIEYFGQNAFTNITKNQAI